MTFNEQSTGSALWGLFLYIGH